MASVFMVVVIGAPLIVVVGLSRPVDIVEFVFGAEAMSVATTMLTFEVLVASRVLERSSVDTLVTIGAEVTVLLIAVTVAVLITVVIARLLMSISTVAQNWRLVDITVLNGCLSMQALEAFLPVWLLNDGMKPMKLRIFSSELCISSSELCIFSSELLI